MSTEWAPTQGESSSTLVVSSSQFLCCRKPSPMYGTAYMWLSLPSSSDPHVSLSGKVFTDTLRICFTNFGECFLIPAMCPSKLITVSKRPGSPAGTKEKRRCDGVSSPDRQPCSHMVALQYEKMPDSLGGLARTCFLGLQPQRL